MHDGGKHQFSLKFLLAPHFLILLADRRLLKLKENLNASAVLIKKADFYMTGKNPSARRLLKENLNRSASTMKKADFYMTGKNPEYPKLIHSHHLESIVVAGLSCSYRRAVLINTSGESNTKIMAFEDHLPSFWTIDA